MRSKIHPTKWDQSYPNKMLEQKDTSYLEFNSALFEAECSKIEKVFLGWLASFVKARRNSVLSE